MTYSYKTHGTCSRRIDFDIDDDNTVHNVHFTGGCNGNLAGISSIVEEWMRRKSSTDSTASAAASSRPHAPTSSRRLCARLLKKRTANKIRNERSASDIRALLPSFGKAITILEDSIEWSSNQ